MGPERVPVGCLNNRQDQTWGWGGGLLFSADNKEH